MKPNKSKAEFIKLRAEGRSYSYIAEELSISKSTCTAWNRELGEAIADLKREELNSLYESYHMTKEARIKSLGGTLERIDEALGIADLSDMTPERLLEHKLKYTEALKEEYLGTGKAYTFGDTIKSEDIVTALGDLLNRVQAGETTLTQARQESLILKDLLGAYTTAEIKKQLDALEAIMRGRA